MRTYSQKILSLLTMLTLVQLVWASNFQGSQSITVSQPVNDDVYYAGETIRINAPVSGDVFCMGQDIFINADVEEDIMGAAGNIYLDAVAKDDVRLAGGKIIISKDVLGDLFIAAGEVTIERGVTIQGDVHMVGGKLIFNGTANGKFKVAGGEVDFGGVAEQEANFRAENLRINGTIRGPSTLGAQHINLDKGALFYQNVRYWQEDGELDFGNSLKEGATATYDESLKSKDDWSFDEGDMWGFVIWWFLAGGLVAVVLTLLFPRFFSDVSHDITENVGKKLGYGVLYFIGLPFVAVLLMITVIGLPLGLFGIFAFGFSVAFSSILTAVVGAFALKEYRYPSWTKGHVILVSLALFLGLIIIGWIPFIGGLITSVASGIAFGAVILQLLEKRKEDNNNDTVIV